MDAPVSDAAWNKFLARHPELTEARAGQWRVDLGALILRMRAWDDEHDEDEWSDDGWEDAA